LWCFGDGGNALVATTLATSVCDKDIDDGIALEKDDDEKTQSKQRSCDCTCKTFIIVGFLMMMAKSTFFLEQGAPKAEIDYNLVIEGWRWGHH
jgi:hypothetical protein